MSEAEDIEKPCVDMATKAGWLHRKLDVGPGGKGWPDHLFLGPNSQYFIVEFKEFSRISDKQHKTLKRLRLMHHPTYCCDDVDMFRRLLIAHSD